MDDRRMYGWHEDSFVRASWQVETVGHVLELQQEIRAHGGRLAQAGSQRAVSAKLSCLNSIHNFGILSKKRRASALQSA